MLLAYIGGNGRRRISVIPLEAEGYTGSVIKSASSGGKNLLYVVPLQDELDMTPLPPDAPEFARMPKASCKKCKTLMPLQTLALHVDQCDGMQNSENSEIEVKLCCVGFRLLSFKNCPLTIEIVFFFSLCRKKIWCL